MQELEATVQRHLRDHRVLEERLHHLASQRMPQPAVQLEADRAYEVADAHVRAELTAVRSTADSCTMTGDGEWEWPAEKTCSSLSTSTEDLVMSAEVGVGAVPATVTRSCSPLPYSLWSCQASTSTEAPESRDWGSDASDHLTCERQGLAQTLAELQKELAALRDSHEHVMLSAERERERRGADDAHHYRLREDIAAAAAEREAIQSQVAALHSEATKLEQAVTILRAARESEEEYAQQQAAEYGRDAPPGRGAPVSSAVSTHARADVDSDADERRLQIVLENYEEIRDTRGVGNALAKGFSQKQTAGPLDATPIVLSANADQRRDDSTPASLSLPSPPSRSLPLPDAEAFSAEARFRARQRWSRSRSRSGQSSADGLSGKAAEDSITSPPSPCALQALAVPATAAAGTSGERSYSAKYSLARWRSTASTASGARKSRTPLAELTPSETNGTKIQLEGSDSKRAYAHPHVHLHSLKPNPRFSRTPHPLPSPIAKRPPVLAPASPAAAQRQVTHDHHHVHRHRHRFYAAAADRADVDVHFQIPSHELLSQ